MAKRKIIADNCYMAVGGVMQKIPVGTIVEASETAYGLKAVTVEEKTIEVATPKKTARRSRDEG